jgi:ADP-heptose:LPS heptosyltransferase
MPTGVVSELPQGATVVVLRMRSLGDIILITPALSLLKKARPDLGIVVLLARPFKGLLAGCPAVTGELIDSGSVLPLFQTLREIRRLKPALCLDLYGSARTARWTFLSGARYRAGYGHVRGSSLYGIKIPRAQEVLGLAADQPVHTAEQHASAVFHLGVPVRDVPPASLHAAPETRDGPYAVVHVAALYHTKEWPLDRFRQIGETLQDRYGLEAIFISAPGRGDMFAGLSAFTCLDNLSLVRLKSLIAGATLFVGNDSGPAHVAAAFGVPTVTVFGSSNSQIWRPWRTASAVVETDWDCKPCKGDRCYAFDEPRCILSVDTSQVQGAIEQLLSQAPSAQPAVRPV